MSDKPQMPVTKWGHNVLVTTEQLVDTDELKARLRAHWAMVSDPNYVPPPSWQGPPITPEPELYQRLLDENEFPDERTAYQAVLVELIKLHGPKPSMVFHDGTVRSWQCEGCDVDGYEWEYPEWPCQTTTVIAQHLGVEGA